MKNSNTIGFAVGDRAAKTADGTSQPLIVQQVSVRPFNRQSLDLTSWKNSAKSAEAIIPRRVLLYNLYHDVSTTDAQIIAVTQKRIDAVTRAQWVFTDKDGEPIEAINQLLDCVGFDDLLTEILNSKFWGYSMVEPTFFINDNGQNEFSLYSVPKKNMRPQQGIIAKEELSDDGINIREGIYAKTVMEFGKADDLGLLLSAAYYAILKRNDISDYAEFIEIFGRGIIDATWDGFDDTQRSKLAKAFEEMGGGGVIIRPDGTKMEIHNNTGNANGDLQKGFALLMDTYISIVLLGTTETTTSSATSGYAQSKTHQEQDENKNETDLNFVRRNLNSRFIKVLKAAGFDTRGGTFVLKKVRKPNKEAFEIHKSMKNDLSIPMDDDFYYEEYGVPKPKNYDELKKQALERLNQQNAPLQDNKKADTPTPTKGKKTKTPMNNKEELSNSPTFWRRVLTKLFLSAPVPKTEAGAKTTICCGDHHTKISLAKFVAESEFDRIKDGIIERAYNAKGKFTFDAELFDYTAKTLTAGFIEGWRTKPKVKLASNPPFGGGGIGFVYDFNDPAVLSAYEMNLFRFSGVKTLYDAEQLNNIFRDKNISNFKQFYDAASSVLNVTNKNWLATEWNLALNVGEKTAEYQRLIQKINIFPYWQYKSLDDGKVRTSHQILHNAVFSATNRVWSEIYPPNGWRCRCYVEPLTKAEVTDEMLKLSNLKLKTYSNSEDAKRAKKAGFNINRSSIKGVFTANQQYIKDLNQGYEMLSQLDNTFYKQPSLTKSIEAASQIIDETPMVAAQYYNSKLIDDVFTLTDYNGRKLTMPEDAFIKHTTDDVKNRAFRASYLNELENILNKPDNVWFNADEKGKILNQFLYIKYYKGEALAAIGQLNNNGEMVLKTWFALKDEYKLWGLLIKKGD